MTYDEFKTAYALRLDRQQEAAVRAAPGSVLLLAVPGSGKTTVLLARLGYLICCCGVQPEEILTMTYTVAATQQLRRRFAARFGAQLAGRMEFRTINGVCARIIRQYERVYDRQAFRLADERELNELVAGLYRSFVQESVTDSELQAMRTAIAYAKNRRLTPDRCEEAAGLPRGFPDVFRAYEGALHTRGWMDYDDQLRYALLILRRCPGLCAGLQARWRHLCVDEAQDASLIQHALIDLLAQHGGSLFLVGDEDQSIYGFRAACPEALLAFAQTHPGAQRLLLEQNYRSTPQIVGAAARFIAQNEGRTPKAMHAVRAPGPAVKRLSVRSRREQYAPLAGIARGCRCETAVLYRDNDSALPLIDLLLRQEIPFRMRPMDSTFFTGRAVQDVTDVIRFAQTPSDAALFLRIYYKFSAGISRAAAEEAVRAGRGQPLLELVADGPHASAWTRRQCAALQTHLKNLLRERADRAVYRIVHFMGYGAFLAGRGLDAGKTQLLEALGEQEPNPLLLLDRLETLCTLVQQGFDAPDCPFTLSTIHGSKGLEYDRVFLLDVADGLLPKQPPRLAAPDEAQRLLEEERRLFYVGMTRAKQELTVLTFRQDGRRSSFDAALFPEEAPPEPQRLAAAAAALRPPAAAPAAADTAARLARFTPGTRVRHAQFGAGTLHTRQGDLISIVFDGGQTRRFSLSAALRRNALTPENDKDREV
ncbi:MAG: ATP-dependent helicase [Clostridiales bacterium]|nr:ATP-dependent helicase [Clostridiales bacterium]